MLGTLALFALAGCGGGYEPDLPAMEREIDEGLEGQLDTQGIKVQLVVECPRSVEWKAGETFKCIAEDQHEGTAVVVVSMQNDDGEWFWEVG